MRIGHTVLTMQNQDLNLESYGLPERYVSPGLLGKGGMGFVLLADDLILGRKVAIKLIHLARAGNSQASERFLKEARILASLDHPNIVRILSSGLTGSGDFYYVMEYLQGLTLREKLKDRNEPLSLALFYEIFRQVLSGLAHAHNHNVIHRDLKPGNIMLEYGGSDTGCRIKLIDFGLARLNLESEASNTASNTIIGSPLYMSPEQCRGSKVDQLSDIYSLGCIMYECLAGRVPFHGDSPLETMYKHMHEEPPELEINASKKFLDLLNSLIKSSLAKDPVLRPQSAEIFLASLNEILKTDPELSGSLLFSPKTSNEKGRKWKSLLLYLALLPILASAAFFIPQHFRAKPAKAKAGDPRKTRQLDELERMRKTCLAEQKRADSASTPETREARANRLAKDLITLSGKEFQLASKESGKSKREDLAKQGLSDLELACKYLSHNNDRLRMLYNRAHLYSLLNRAQEANSDFENYLDLSIKAHGKGSWDHLFALQLWIRFLLGQKNLEQAEKLIEEHNKAWVSDSWWEHQAEPIDKKFCEVVWLLAGYESKSNEENYRIVKLVNECCKAIRLHTPETQQVSLQAADRKLELEKSIKASINESLVLVLNNQLPRLDSSPESKKLAAETMELSKWAR